MLARERRRIAGQQGAVVTDTRYFPIVVMHWQGQVDAALAREFGRWMDELLGQLQAEDLRMATLADLTRADPPSGEGRRALVELRTRNQRHSRGRVLLDVIVTDRQLLRGITESLIWINPRAPAVLATTLDEGLRRCREALHGAGIAAPSLRAEELELPL